MDAAKRSCLRCTACGLPGEDKLGDAHDVLAQIARQQVDRAGEALAALELRQLSQKIRSTAPVLSPKWTISIGISRAARRNDAPVLVVDRPDG